MERNFGYAVARAYAGHAVPKFNMHGVTQVYVKAGIEEVATALQAMTGERHPLALTVTGDGSSSVTGRDLAGRVGLGRSTMPEWLRAEGAVETVQDRLVERILQLYEEAEQAGHPRPGRDALVRATGASNYRVSAAQAEIGGTIRPHWMDDLVDRIRRLYEEAEQAGHPRPGRRMLVKATGASARRVIAAVAEINRTADPPGTATSGPGVAAEAPSAPLVTPTGRDGRGRWR